MYQLLLEGGKQRLCHCIVEAIPAAAHALVEAVMGEKRANCLTCILRTTVAMEDGSPGIPSLKHSHLHRIEYDFLTQGFAHRPTDDPARVGIEDRAKIDPTLPGRHIRDVAEVEFICYERLELLHHEVWADRLLMAAVRGLLEPPLPNSACPHGSHQPRNAFVAAAKSPFS